MRRCGKSPEFVVHNNEFLGIILPSDCCAEHERGCDKLLKLFGINKYEPTEGPFGLERRKATKSPSGKLLYGKHNDMAALTVGFSIFNGENLFDSLPICLKHFPKSSNLIDGAWNDYSFGLIVRGDNINKLQYLYNQIEASNIVIFQSTNWHDYRSQGLVIAFANTFPKIDSDNFLKSDKDKMRLYKTLRNSGIVNKLERSRKEYFSLTPAWCKDHERKNTKYDIVLWLNPRDQFAYNYGWFTVEDIEQWINNKGPVVKNNIPSLTEKRNGKQ